MRSSKRRTARSAAAVRGWRTRRANLEFERRSKAAKKGWVQRKRAASPKRPRPRRPPRRHVLHLLTVQIKTRERGPRGGLRTRSFSRDILVPGAPNASLRSLLKKAARTLPQREQYAIAWTKQKGRKITRAVGPQTRAKKANLR